MIKINGYPAQISYFPDGTFLIKENVYEWAEEFKTRSVCFEWYFENNAELLALQFLAWHFQDHGMITRLYMPYIPNARMDRVKKPEDVFTLKYFARIINSIGFEKVRVVDPHSAVSEALIDRLEIVDASKYIQTVLEVLSHEPGILQVVFPDEGAEKRYAGFIPAEIPKSYGMKVRDWSTGKILGLELHGASVAEAEKVLVIDDICSYGGSAYYTAKHIKDRNPEAKVYFYVTHCENSVLEGKFGEKEVPLLDTGLIEALYTTGDILTKEHERIILV